MADRIVAEVFPPGEFIKEELEARGWSQVDLAEIIGRPPRVVSELISAKRSISPETAKQLGEAFGTGGQFWMNLESVYQLARAKSDEGTVARRARLYQMAPLKEMIRRNWIEPSTNIEVLEKRVLDFFEISTLDEEPSFFAHAARKSTSYQKATPAQRAWLFRARKLARAITAASFSEKTFAEGLERLRKILSSLEELRHVPRTLAEAGIRFLVIEPLPQTRIDGVCFWLDKHSPVIAISLRYDRIDWFWHTVLHETGHVRNRDGISNQDVRLDTDLVGEGAQPFDQKPGVEQRADKFATEFSIKKSELDHFVARVRPLYSKQKILGFAARLGIHPGLVIGQLQHRGEVSYSHSREMLVKVREFIVASALTDGWGYMPPSGL